MADTKRDHGYPRLVSNRIPYRRLGIDADGDAHGSLAPWVFDGRRSIRSVHKRTGMRPAGDPFPKVATLASDYTPSMVDGYTLAAAPALLAALEAALPLVEAHDQDFGGYMLTGDQTDESARAFLAMRERVRAAIAAAKGES